MWLALARLPRGLHALESQLAEGGQAQPVRSKKSRPS
ncbi:protein of unknown function (plasmid) [Paraburkholderia dioscoreae]|uniref:Uncharacterized protein n=1 Tax=Paraburkholderia dioscoreae TaxID=2604047 RepID=A0A5Q4Z9S1_9BURK|nr:protein of unknown function [Paraburkholderia dioscoreae]